MLKFFCNIRRRLLESGKIRSYTLYAIGEIFLVVIGILIALTVSEWNSDRNANMYIKEALALVSMDLEREIIYFKSYNANTRKRLKKISILDCSYPNP